MRRADRQWGGFLNGAVPDPVPRPLESGPRRHAVLEVGSRPVAWRAWAAGRGAAAVLVLAALLSAGCSVAPVATTQAEVAQRVAQDRAGMFVGQEPVGGPMTYSEVAARALKYNLDVRLKAMEGALSIGQLDVAGWDMFPRVLANAGYVSRAPEDGSRTKTIETGFESLFHQTSSERTRSIANAEFSWNVLDFGVSYYRARQLADQVLIADERKRKVVQNIVADARNAYWRALGAQRLSGRIDALLQRSQESLDRARSVERQGLMSKPLVLAYQRALLDTILLLQYRRQELELSKQELAALMNLPPGTAFTLADVPIRFAPAAVIACASARLLMPPEALTPMPAPTSARRGARRPGVMAHRPPPATSPGSMTASAPPPPCSRPATWSGSCRLARSWSRARSSTSPGA